MSKILVVDDSETIREKLVKDLSAAGHTVVSAYDGVNGLEVLEQNNDVQLILADINMPHMDGITMCAKVREKDEYQNVLLFVLTTEFDPELKVKGKSIGVKLWITKPVDTKKLITVIAKIIPQNSSW